MTERERLDAYVQWNQMTRHQIIVAHLTLIASCDEIDNRLRKAFGIESNVGRTDLIDQVIAKTNRE